MSYRILSELNFTNVSDLAKLASAVSAFYGLEVLVVDSDFNPSITKADLRVVTPNGRTVVHFHATLYTNSKYWSLGGQSFVTSDDTTALYELRKKERNQ